MANGTIIKQTQLAVDDITVQVGGGTYSNFFYGDHIVTTEPWNADNIVALEVYFTTNNQYAYPMVFTDNDNTAIRVWATTGNITVKLKVIYRP